MSNRKSIVAFTLLAVLTVSIVLLSAPVKPAHSEATAVTSTRMGAWVDTIHVSANPSSLQSDSIGPASCGGKSGMIKPFTPACLAVSTNARSPYARIGL